jgi:hypothetical protein
MIPTTSTLGSESFTSLRIRGEVLLTRLGPRGTALAEALRGRFAQQDHGYYLTPARAEKWWLLFAAGFIAIKRQHEYGGMVWFFERDGDDDAPSLRRLSLMRAVRVARNEADISI